MPRRSAVPPATALPRLELICLGAPSARLEGREPPAEVLWRRHFALLIYLALSPDRTRTRDHLVGVLWPEKPQDRARHALNESLRRLRHCLGAGRLQSREDGVTLSDAGLEVDAWQLDAMSDRDPERAVALMRGDFLEGFLLDEARAFEDWVTLERARRRSRAVALLVAHAERRLAACRFGDARDAAQRALALEPHSEPAARILLRAAALEGDAAGALAAYHAFAARLAEGIGEQPSRELASLAERIRHQRTRPARAQAVEAEAPLVGREPIHAEVFALLQAGLSDGPRTLMITGAPGMGRTRLLAECAQRLALEGAIVALARPLASDHDAPWSTLRLLMRAGLGGAPGLVGADGAALGVLAGLVPELAERSPPRQSRDVAEVAAAIAAVGAAVAAENPVGLLIDDAHLSDGATLAALRAALEGLAGAPVLLVLSGVDAGEGVTRELLALRREVGRGLRGASVRLDPLGESDVKQLVTALAPWCQEDAERDRLARRLTFETGGNPFFVVTLLGGLERLAALREDFVAWPRPRATFESPLPFSVPELAKLAIAARVADLDAESQRLLSAASLGGLALDLDLIAALAELPRSGVELKLAAAERHHLIQFDGERYVFAAPLIAEVVRAECLTAGQRKTLRQRAIAALASRVELDARVLRVELMAAAEPGAAAFEEAVAVARAGMAAGSSRTARRALAAAERAAGRDLESRRPLIDALRAQADAPHPPIPSP